MRVGLSIIYWGNDPFREAAFDKVLETMEDMGIWNVIGVVSPSSSPPNRGVARNMAMRSARDDNCDVAVVLDADSIPQKDPLMRAILGAASEGGIHFPHNKVRALAKDGSVSFEYGPSAGGCWVAKPSEWFAIGGMEEQGGWSVDDRCLLAAINTFAGGPQYHEGVLTCLWHARGVEHKVPEEDKRLIHQYLDAEGDREKMRSLIESRGRTLNIDT